MLFGPSKITYFNELEINGEEVEDETEDYTQTASDDEEPETTEDDVEVASEDNNTDDDLEDFTDNEFEDTDDEEPETTEDDTVSEEDNNTDDDLEDFTDSEFEDTDETDDETGDDSEEGEVTEDESAEDTTDDLEDFTDSEFEDTDESGNDSEEGEATEDDGNDSEEGESSDNTEESDTKPGTLADMEKTLFSDLSPQQLAIKNNELLQQYITLYETINNIFNSINRIPKTISNTRPLSFIADQLIELKDMVNYTITTTYITRTYVENMTYYKQALVILEQLNTMLKALVQKPTK